MSGRLRKIRGHEQAELNKLTAILIAAIFLGGVLCYLSMVIWDPVAPDRLSVRLFGAVLMAAPSIIFFLLHGQRLIRLWSRH